MARERRDHSTWIIGGAVGVAVLVIVAQGLMNRRPPNEIPPQQPHAVAPAAFAIAPKIEKPPLIAGKDVGVVEWLEVRLDKGRIRKIPSKGFSGTVYSKEEQLEVEARISVTDPSKKYEYESWCGGRDDLHSPASARDNFGNAYQALKFGTVSTILGRTEHATVDQLHPAKDVLVFQRPVPAAEWVDIELPVELTPRKITRLTFRVLIADVAKW